jgi:hypothetical protein
MKVERSAKSIGGLFLLGMTACGGEAGEIEQVGVTREELTTVYQAENAFDIDEGVVESIHAGFTGTGYVNIDNFSNTFMWHIVNTGFAGPATLRVRYANGTGTGRPIRISVNGATAGTLAGGPTGSWATWATASVPINLAAGNNDVIHASVTSDGMPNIDRFEIVQSVTQTFQAENAFDIDEGVVESIHAGFTGTGYVNIDNFSNTFMWHIVSSPVAAVATLRVRYANGTGTNRPIRVTVNGATAGTVNGAPTGSWSTWATATLPINLVAGDNDMIHASVTSDGMPNVDRFEITW